MVRLSRVATSARLVAGLLVISVIATACSDDAVTPSPSASPTSIGTSGPAPSGTDTVSVGDTVPAEPTLAPDDTEAATPPISEADAWALEYTGGAAGVASGEPIKIGYVNQEDLFPGNTVGVDVAVAYVNAELGGAAGRPLEIVPCRITIAEDGARCGSTLAADPDVVAVLTGSTVLGNRDLYEALDGVKPVIVGNGITGDDLTTTAGHTFTAGSSGLIVGLAGFVVQELVDVDNVAVFGVNGPSGRAMLDLLLKPVMDEAGIAVNYVGVDSGASADGVRAAIEAAGAQDADVFVTLLTVEQCIGVRDAIVELDIDPVVLGSGLCSTSPMSDHLTVLGEPGPVPDGWYVGGYGYNSFEPDVDSGMLTYVTALDEYGVPAPGAASVDHAGQAGPMFASVLTLTKFVNELGGDQLDQASLDGAIRGFTGPMMMQVGPLSCGDVVVLGLPIFVTPCASHIGVQQFVDGGWVSVRDGLNGDPIDVTAP